MTRVSRPITGGPRRIHRLLCRARADRRCKMRYVFSSSLLCSLDPLGQSMVTHAAAALAHLAWHRHQRPAPPPAVYIAGVLTADWAAGSERARERVPLPHGSIRQNNATAREGRPPGRSSPSEFMSMQQPGTQCCTSPKSG